MTTVKEKIKSVTVYVYGGKKYKTLREIAEERGVKQVTKRDFERLGITEHLEGELVEGEETESIETLEETDKDTPIEKLFNGELEKLYAPEEVEIVKSLKNLPIEEFASKLKKMSLKEIEEVTSILKLDWKDNENLGIKRMRMTMALRKFYYPNGEKLPQEPKSDFKGMSLETLKNMAESLGVEYKVYSSDKITKMWLINKLKNSKKV